MNSASEAARRRVAPLAPDDRRAALIEATLPLLVEFGAAVSTRQIAQAAGVAEGTIFRVFPDKNSLILAVLRHALDPEPGVRALRQIPARLDLRDRLVGATTLMLSGMKQSGRLHMLARQIVIELGQESQFGAEMRENHLRIQMALASVFEPDRAQLRVSPHTAARLLLLNIIGTGGPVFGETEALDADEIVSLVLDGLLTRPPTGADAGSDGTVALADRPGRAGTATSSDVYPADRHTGSPADRRDRVGTPTGSDAYPADRTHRAGTAPGSDAYPANRRTGSADPGIGPTSPKPTYGDGPAGGTDPTGGSARRPPSTNTPANPEENPC